MRACVTILLFIVSIVANGQQKQPFGAVLKTADSIQITSHTDLHMLDTIPGKSNAYYKVV